MFQNSTLHLSSFILFLFLFISSHGEESNQADYLSPFNVIGSQEDIPKLEGTGAILGSTELTPFFHTDVNEVFRQVPGVYLRPEDGYGLFPNISLRGVDSHRSAKVTILEDGIPSSPSPFSDPAAYYSPTAGRMSGFEILKGSSQLSQGPNTIGGVINYLSTPIPENQISHLRVSYGEDNERVAHAYSGGKTDLGSGKLGFLVEFLTTEQTVLKQSMLWEIRLGEMPRFLKQMSLSNLGMNLEKMITLNLRLEERIWMRMSVTLA